MSLAANALLTLNEFKGFMGIEEADTSTDTVNENSIDAASQYIEKFTGRKWITPGSALEEVLSGNGTTHCYTNNVPIVSITDISYRSGADGSSWTSITDDWTYTFEAASGRIYFTDGSVFTGGSYNWRITYSYGYAVASIPGDMKMACAILAALSKKQFEDTMHGVSTKSFGSQSVSYTLDKVPDNVRELLTKYKKVA